MVFQKGKWCPHSSNIVERLYQAYGDRVVFIIVAGGIQVV